MPNCAKCGTKLEYQGGHMALNIGGRYARGHRNWKCSTCGARPHEPVAYDYDNDVLLVNLKEGQVLEIPKALSQALENIAKKQRPKMSWNDQARSALYGYVAMHRARGNV